MIAGAGCASGAALAQSLARAGARVVVIDSDERAVLEIARSRAESIDTLALDLMEPAVCARLGAVWKDEPLHLLVQLSPIRHPGRPARALACVEALTAALAEGLRAARGCVVIVDAAAPGASLAQSLLAEAAARLPAALQAALRSGPAEDMVAVNGVRLGSATPGHGEIGALCAVVSALARPGRVRFGGALLTLLPPFPDASD